MGYYKDQEVGKINEMGPSGPHSLPHLAPHTQLRIEDIGSYIASQQGQDSRQHLEDILVKMFYFLELGDLETYRQLRDIVVSVIQNRSRRSQFIH